MNITMKRTMNGFIQRCCAVLLAVFIVMFAGGCAGLDLVGSETSSINSVSLHRTTPGTPAVLNLDERLSVRINYARSTTNETVVFVRPYHEGQQPAGAKVHSPVSCKKQRGRIEGWVTFSKAASIDELRVTMLDNVDRVVLKEEKYPVDFQWSE